MTELLTKKLKPLNPEATIFSSEAGEIYALVKYPDGEYGLQKLNKVTSSPL